MADQRLPPLGLWCGIAILWFLALSGISSYYRTNLKAIPPGIIFGTIVVIGVIIAGAGITGLGLVYLLIIPSAVATVSILREPPSATVTLPVRRAVGITGAIAAIAIAIAAVQCVRIRSSRSDVDFVLKWGDVVPSMMILEHWKYYDPKNLEGFRTLLVKSRATVVIERAAQRLAEVGDPTIDIPLIEDALKRCEADSMPQVCKDSLGESLQKLQSRAPSKKR